MAVESATAVVPTKLRIGQMAWVDAYWPAAAESERDPSRAPRRGRGVFGEPIWFPSGSPPADATTRLEEALAAL